MFADSLHELLMVIRETEDFITETLDLSVHGGPRIFQDQRHSVSRELIVQKVNNFITVDVRFITFKLIQLMFIYFSSWDYVLI